MGWVQGHHDLGLNSTDMRADFRFGRDRLGGAGSSSHSPRALGAQQAREKRRGDPSCRSEAGSCSHAHFTGARMRNLEGSPAVQGNPQGLCGTAHHPQRRGRIGGREEGNARRTRVGRKVRLG